MKVIFLDIDGVLNSMDYYEESDFENSDMDISPIDPLTLDALKDIVDRTAAKIVLTSSWRAGWEKNPEECDTEGRVLNDAFGQKQMKIFDRTGYDDTYEPGTRSREIIKWLEECPEKIESFLILDDCDFQWKKYRLNGHWIQPNFDERGLEKRHVEACVKILKKFSWRLWLRNLRK